ncbi:MAG: L-lactate dehydrogenase [Bacillota bacterium]|nr:L-lactate dehydrogenase [Bacillota bacterium]HOA92036.1 L-lactate dehydrogenase [Bacillota bacterium]HOL13114.1 L-lactate dehydrogenase [Bacillota bacterium]HOP54666.1 L-lactate dehydrogenase [Bacillota bacterium]HPT61682.1 L-lactate dehydrogenase [Bacillota bacterium]
MIKKNKVAVIGAGQVGATTAFTLAVKGLVSELVIIDINRDKAEGEALDINHGMPFMKPAKIYAGTYEDTKDAEVVLITAGLPRKPGQSRRDLIHTNSRIIKDIVTHLNKYAEDPVIVVATNPVDLMALTAQKVSKQPKSKVFGSGTLLDTARFKYALAQNCNIEARSISAEIIGEHGEGEIPVWSLANVVGVPLAIYCSVCDGICEEEKRVELFERVRDSGMEVIKKKGATYYAIALTLARITEAILGDENSVLTVSTYVDGYLGVTDVSMGLPAVVGAGGIQRLIDLPLSLEEQKSFIETANVLKDLAKDIEEFKPH